MLLPDVNVLVDAFREDSPFHEGCRQWLDQLVNSSEPFGISDLVLSGFLRVVTHPSIFTPPTALAEALPFVQGIRSAPNCVIVWQGLRHWKIFEDLCLATNARGGLVPDAYFAALAIESGNEWVTSDRNFGRFPGLRWRYPSS